jgi:putative addiction module component (TIGR02574 family)
MTRYDPGGRWRAMSTDPDEITAAALALPEEDRLNLMARLAESVDPPPGAEYVDDEAWEAEIARRIEEVRSGAVTPIPWAEVRKRLRKDADGDAG